MSESNSETLQVKESRWPSKSGHLIFWPIAILGVAADLWSKSAVFQWLSNAVEYKKIIVINGQEYIQHEKVFIDGFFSFLLAHNDGAAFSMFSGNRGFLVGISVAASIAVIGIFLFGKVKHKTMIVSLGLFFAGIVGNLYDRAATGLVRDFIDVHYKEVYHWPTFNLADSMLCTAVGLMIIMQIATACRKSDHEQK